MKTVGPFVAARPLDSQAASDSADTLDTPPTVTTLHALDRLTGMPALVYVLPHSAKGTAQIPVLPQTPSLIPYLESGLTGDQTYLACELPPHASLASDPFQAALGGLRALNALHEANLIHGGVGPFQLWEWDGEVRLAGAALPWSEPKGSLAAPEGGSSAAADLYALGVTLLRMGPLPVSLSDLLSDYPAQRPSARDALARFNAGPPLPQPPAPLLVQAPLHPRVASEAIPVFDWEKIDSGKLLSSLDWLSEVQSSEVQSSQPSADEPGSQLIIAAAPSSVVIKPQPSESKSGAAPAPYIPPYELQEGLAQSELLNFLARFPTLDEEPLLADPLGAPAFDKPVVAPSSIQIDAKLTEAKPSDTKPISIKPSGPERAISIPIASQPITITPDVQQVTLPDSEQPTSQLAPQQAGSGFLAQAFAKVKLSASSFSQNTAAQANLAPSEAASLPAPKQAQVPEATTEAAQTHQPHLAQSQPTQPQPTQQLSSAAPKSGAVLPAMQAAARLAEVKASETAKDAQVKAVQVTAPSQSVGPTAPESRPAVQPPAPSQTSNQSGTSSQSAPKLSKKQMAKQERKVKRAAALHTAPKPVAPKPSEPKQTAPTSPLRLSDPLPASLTVETKAPEVKIIETRVPEPKVTVQERRMPAVAANAEAAPTFLPRQLKPVKIGWSEDGSWQVKKGAPEQVGGVVIVTPNTPAVVGNGPPPFVRQRKASASSSNRFNPLWLLGLIVVVVLMVFLIRMTVGTKNAALKVTDCCNVTVRLLGAGGQSLDAPVRLFVLRGPKESRLSAGSLVGQGSGPLKLDVAGSYALNVESDGYAPQTVNVTLPTVQPLDITLQ